MDWEHLRHFSAFAAEGSLSGAARSLGVEHATVARRIAALEDELAIKLVDRRGRRLIMTPDGERIAGIARRMDADANAISRAVSAARAELSGSVTISAPPALAATLLAAPLAALQQRHPNLEIRLIGESRQAELARREADVAIRLSRPEKGDLTIVRLGEMTFHFYASPIYLKTVPETNWRFVGYDAPLADAPQQVRLREVAAGRPIAFTTNDIDIQLAATKAGAGIAILPTFIAKGDPALARANDDEFHRDIWLAVHSDMRMAANIRAVVEALKNDLSGAI